MRDYATNSRWMASIMITGLLILVGSYAQAQVEPPSDHYGVYALEQPLSLTNPVTIEDEFGTFTYTNQLSLIVFLVPDQKTHDGVVHKINDPGLHYTWWYLGRELFDRPGIQVENQFGPQLLDVGGSEQYLMNPALKNPEPDEELPLANHYKCYSVTGQSVDVPVTLENQFTSHSAIVREPAWFCTPAKKTVEATGEVYEIVDPDRQLVCYWMDPLPLRLPTQFSDQFVVAEEILLLDTQIFCVPSSKHDPTQIYEKTWGSLKTLYR